MLSDLRHAARLLAQTPAFTLFAVIALAVGIGANTTVFSVVNGVLLRPPAYADPGRLALMQTVNPQQGVFDGYTSYDNFQDLARHSHSLRDIAAISPRWNFTLHAASGAEEVYGYWVSPSLFPLLGVKPILGRALTEADNRADGIHAAVLSYELWQTRFGGSPSAVGSQLPIDDSSATIVGVMPPGFRLLEDASIWIPLAPNPINKAGRAVRYLRLEGRLAPGVSIEQARAELTGSMRDIETRYPAANAGYTMRIQPLREYLTGDVRPTMLLLAAAVGLVLLIACANIANLMLTRALARRQETAIRIALGASRLRLTRQLLAESLTLSALGGCAGVLLAMWGVYGAERLGWSGIPSNASLAIDGRVLAFTLACTAFCGILVGLLPALRSFRSGAADMLGGGRRSATAGVAGTRLRSALMVSEVALTMMLLAGSGLLLRSLTTLLAVNPGFDAHNLLTFQLNLPSSQYSKPEQLNAFHDRLAERIAALPGVRSVGAVSRLPFGEGNITTSVTIEGQPAAEGQEPGIDFRAASASYFATMGIPLLEGRQPDLARRDELLVNQAAARRFWPGESALGKRIKLGPNPAKRRWLTITGIVGDVHHVDLAVAPHPEVYVPNVLNPLGAPIFVVRAETGRISSVQSLIPAIRAQLRTVDPEVPMFNVATMEELVDRSLQNRRIGMLLLSAFAAAALALAAAGLYGVISFAVGSRTREIGIRIALGARRSTVLGMVLAQGFRVTLAGLGLGLVGFLAAAPLLRGLLYGVAARDPVTLAAGATVLALCGLVASYLPARRAAGLDPMAALRDE